MQPLDYILLAGILALAVLALWFYRRQKKAGKTCGGGCAGCPHAGKCDQGGTPPKDS